MSDLIHKKSGELPVTRAILQETENSLKSEITSVRLEVKAVDAKVESLRGEIASVRGEIASVQGEVESVRGEVESVRGEIAAVKNELKSDIASMNATMHKILALVEEQKEQNRFVLDGYGGLDRRLTALENPTHT